MQEKRLLLQEIASATQVPHSGNLDDVGITAFLRDSYPLRVIADCLEPRKSIVLGERGAGKSHLFRWLTAPEAYRSLLDSIRVRSFGYHLLSNVKGAKSEHITEMVPRSFLPGFCATHRGANFPDAAALDELCHHYPHEDDLVVFWLGLLAKVILGASEDREQHYVPATIVQELGNWLPGELHSIDRWFPAATEHKDSIYRILKDFDDHLTESETPLGVAYDDLDRLGLSNFTRSRIVGSLLGMWAGMGRSWKSMRPKIFLRPDVYKRRVLSHSYVSGFPTFCEIYWDARSLLSMCFKRLANRSGETTRDWLRAGGVNPIEEPDLGWDFEPSLSDADVKRLVFGIVGQHVSARPQKADSYDWLWIHLRDANGRVNPLVVLELFHHAALMELDEPRASDDSLIHHTHLRSALSKASLARIAELESDFLWLPRLRDHLREKTVPMPETVFLRIIEETNWENDTEDRPSPAPLPFLEYLNEIGIIHRSENGYVHFPDIYLYGLGMQRR
jgi:hypothetical protein